MERILVSMNTRCGAWGAWSRAISLAKRIDAKVYALLVLPSTTDAAKDLLTKSSFNIRHRLELLIELAKSEGIRIEYFISEGDYEEEVIQFVDQNRITLLVAESAGADSRQTDRTIPAIRKILHRIKCRVELVSPRRIQQLSH